MAEDRRIDLTSDIEKMILDVGEKIVNKNNKTSMDVDIKQKVTGTQDVKNATKAINDYAKALSNIPKTDLNALKRYKAIDKKDALNRINMVNIKEKPGDLVSFVNAYKAQFDDWDQITEEMYKGIDRIKAAYNELSQVTNADGQLKYGLRNSIDSFKTLFSKYSDMPHIALSLKFDLNFDDADVIRTFEERRNALIEKLMSLDKGKGRDSFGDEYEEILGDSQSIKDFAMHYAELERIIEIYGGQIPERLREMYSAIEKENKDGSLRIESAIQRGSKNFDNQIKQLRSIGSVDGADIADRYKEDEKNVQKYEQLSKRAGKVFDSIIDIHGQSIRKKWTDETYYTDKISALEEYLASSQRIKNQLLELRDVTENDEDISNIDRTIKLLEHAEDFAQEKIQEIREIFNSIDFESERASKEAERALDKKREKLRNRMLDNDDFTVYGDSSWISEYVDMLNKDYDNVEEIYDKFTQRVQQAKEDFYTSGIGGSGSGGDDWGFGDSATQESTENIEKIIELLNRLVDEIHIVSTSIGTIDEESGIGNLITQFDGLIQKISELQEAVGRINFNVVINDPSKDEDFWKKQLQRYRDYFQKAVKTLGGMDFAYNAIDQSSFVGDFTDIAKRFNQEAMDNSNLKPEQIVQNYQEFFKYLKEAAKIMREDTDDFSMAVKESVKNLPTSDVKALIRNNKRAQAKEGASDKADAITQAINDALTGNKDKEDIDISKHLGDLTGVIEDLKKIQELLNQIADNKAISENVDRITLKLDAMQQSFRDLLRNLNESVRSNQVNLEMGDGNIEINAAQKAEESAENIKILIENLEKLNTEIATIRQSLGTVDSESGITSLLSQFTELSNKIDNIQTQLSTGILSSLNNQTSIEAKFGDLAGIAETIKEIRSSFDSIDQNSALPEFIDSIITKLDSMNQSFRDLIRNLKDSVDNISLKGNTDVIEGTDDSKEQKLLALISELKDMVGNLEVMPSIPRPKDFVDRIDELLYGYFASVDIKPNFIPGNFISDVNNMIEDEISSFSRLAEYLSQTVPEAVEVKNKAFREEVDVVSIAIKQEIDQIKKLEKELSKKVPEAVKKKNDAFKKEDIVKNDDLSETVSSAKETAKATAEAAEGIDKESKSAIHAKKNKEDFAEANAKVAESAKNTKEETEGASVGIEKEGNSAKKAIKEKNELTEANKKVAKSAKEAKEATSSKVVDKGISSNYDKELNALKQILKLQHEIDMAEAKGADNIDEIKARNNAKIKGYRDELKAIKAVQQQNGTNEDERNRIKQELKDIELKYKAEVEGEKQATALKEAKIQKTKEEKEATRKAKEEIDEEVEALKRVEKQRSQMNASIKSMTSKLGKEIIQGDKVYDEGLITQWNNLKNKLGELQGKIELDDTDLDEAQKDLDALAEDFYRITSKETKKDYKLASENALSKINSKIEEFRAKNTKLGKELSVRLDEIIVRKERLLQAGLSHSALEKELKAIDAELNNIKADADAAGESGKSFGKKVIDSLSAANARFIANYFSFQDLIRYARTAIDSIHELDTALVDLKKTTTMTNADLEDFYQNSPSIAKKTGVTTQEIISQASAWSRLGYSSKEAAENMAQLSSQFAKISPGTSVDDATDYLVSTMKAFHIDVADVESEIMDAVNRIGKLLPKHIVMYGAILIA